MEEKKNESGFDRWSNFRIGEINQSVCGHIFFFSVPEMEGVVNQKRAVTQIHRAYYAVEIGRTGH